MTDLILNDPYLRAGAIVVVSLIAAFFIEFIFRHVLMALVGKTQTDIDDKVVLALRRPIYLTIVLLAVAYATREAELSDKAIGLTDKIIQTLCIIIWAIAAAKVVEVVFSSLARRATEHSFVQPRTLPLFDIFGKLSLFAAASYLIMLSWSINIGAWLASAGIAGIALGFAAKDSLSNLFAGIFIIADAPYSLGDFIELDGKLRGSVTAIGFRSTRLVTLDDIEIVVPNSVLGNARIVNESGGPHRMARVSVDVSCAYGSDVDLVRDVLLACAEGAAHVVQSPTPMVRFSSFGGSGLEHELLVWIERPYYRELVTDDLNRRIYKAFAKNGIEIPYSKHDIFIKQMPAMPAFPKSA